MLTKGIDDFLKKGIKNLISKKTKSNTFKKPNRNLNTDQKELPSTFEVADTPLFNRSYAEDPTKN